MESFATTHRYPARRRTLSFVFVAKTFQVLQLLFERCPRSMSVEDKTTGIQLAVHDTETLIWTPEKNYGQNRFTRIFWSS